MNLDLTNLKGCDIIYISNEKEIYKMAMIDYGAIAWKNGKLISTDMFTPMEDMVGWNDSDLDLEPPLEGNYFAYIGDKDFTLAFYKNVMRIYNLNCSYDNDTIFFGSESFEGWKKWRFWTITNGKYVEIIVKPKRFHNYYVCHMKYNGDKYKVAFGYGVDLGYYKKWRIIDYFGTPWYKIGSMWYDIKHMCLDDLYDFLDNIKLRLKRKG